MDPDEVLFSKDKNNKISTHFKNPSQQVLMEVGRPLTMSGFNSSGLLLTGTHFWLAGQFVSLVEDRGKSNSAPLLGSWPTLLEQVCLIWPFWIFFFLVWKSLRENKLKWALFEFGGVYFEVFCFSFVYQFDAWFF